FRGGSVAPAAAAASGQQVSQTGGGTFSGRFGVRGFFAMLAFFDGAGTLGITLSANWDPAHVDWVDIAAPFFPPGGEPCCTSAMRPSETAGESRGASYFRWAVSACWA